MFNIFITLFLTAVGQEVNIISNSVVVHELENVPIQEFLSGGGGGGGSRSI